MIRKLASYIGEFKKASILTPLFIILEAICEVIIPFLMAAIIDNGINNSDMGYIAKIGVLMLVISMSVLGAVVINRKKVINK